MLHKVFRLGNIAIRMPLQNLLRRCGLICRTISLKIIDRTIIDRTMNQVQRRLNQMQIRIAGGVMAMSWARADNEARILPPKIFLQFLEVRRLTDALARFVPFVTMPATLERILMMPIAQHVVWIQIVINSLLRSSSSASARPTVVGREARVLGGVARTIIVIHVCFIFIDPLLAPPYHVSEDINVHPPGTSD